MPRLGLAWARKKKCNSLDMSRLRSIVAMLCLSMLAAVSLVGCSGPKAIPDRDLVKIFHDSFLANAYISECNITEDSLLLYEPILARYGYTVEDMQHTVLTIAGRKSSRLSDLISEASDMLDEEFKTHNYKLRVLDTIDNVAKRHFTRVVYSDSLIRVRRLSDTAKLHIAIDNIIPGDYTIEFEYYIDTTDENRNSRVEAYLKGKSGTQDMRHTFMLTRYREAKYSRKFTADTSHTELHVNIFYQHKNDEPKKPSIKVTNFTVTRVIPTLQAVDSLFDEQMGALVFNGKLMTEPLERGIPQPKEHKSSTSAKRYKEPENEDDVKPKREDKEAKPNAPKSEQTAKPKPAAPKAIGVTDEDGKIISVKVDGKVPTNTVKPGEQPKKFDPTKANREKFKRGNES